MHSLLMMLFFSMRISKGELSGSIVKYYLLIVEENTYKVKYTTICNNIQLSKVSVIYDGINTFLNLEMEGNMRNLHDIYIHTNLSIIKEIFWKN